NDRLRAREPAVERRRIPREAGVLERIRVAAESLGSAGAPVPDAREAGSGEVNAGLDGMTRRALPEKRGAASRIAARRLRRSRRRGQKHEHDNASGERDSET